MGKESNGMDTGSCRKKVSMKPRTSRAGAHISFPRCSKQQRWHSVHGAQANLVVGLGLCLVLAPFFRRCCSLWPDRQHGSQQHCWVLWLTLVQVQGQCSCTHCCRQGTSCWLPCSQSQEPSILQASTPWNWATQASWPPGWCSRADNDR